jgi:ABC-type glycerol-3-phosphate transport system substrate-binding protein
LKFTRISGLAVIGLLLATATIWASGEQDAGAAASDEPKSLLYWHKDSPAFHDWVTNLADQYMIENPNTTINIERQTGSWGDYGTKIRLVLRSGKDVPDVIQIHDIDNSTLASAGFFSEAPEPIAKIMDENSLHPTFRKMAHQDGDLDKPVMIVNLFTHWQQLYYNSDYLQEAGLPMRGAETWDELREYARKLVKTDASGNITRAGFTFRIQDPAWAFGAWMHSAGGTWLNDDNSAADVMTPDGREAWGNALQFLYDVTWVDKAGDFRMGEPREAFHQGLNAISAEGIYDIARISNNAPDLNWIIDNIPTGEYSSIILAVRPVSVYKDSQNPDEAWRFLGYIIQDENISELFDIGSFSLLPPYMSASMLPKFQSEEPWKIATQQKNLRSRMQGTGATDYYTQVGREIEAFLSKTKTLDDALDGMVEAYEEITETRTISEIKVPFDD